MAGYTKNAAGGYDVNYNDERFKAVESEKNQEITNTGNMYDQMINNSDSFYNQQIDAAKQYEQKQSEIQQANTNYATEIINQNKEQTTKDYTKEQKASYVDYEKQSNAYGVNAEQMAANGMAGTGYSESSQVSMYNQYQGRVATARESYNKAVLNYNNQYQQALLSNNEVLSEIAYNSLQNQLQLANQAFQYKNSVLESKTSSLQQLNQMYYSRNQDILNQINNEIDLQMELDRIDREYEQWEAETAQWWASYNQQERQIQEQHNQFMKEYALKERESAASINATNAQAAYYRAQANSSSSGSFSDSNSNSSGLSKNAQNMLNRYNEQSKIHSDEKDVVLTAINTQYRNGNITASDVKNLVQQMGLE